MIRPLCVLPKQEKISTGQAGPEINRDLETLFLAVNEHSRCLARVKQIMDALTGGSFAEGGGLTFTLPGGGGPGGSTQTGSGAAQTGTERPWMFISSGSNVTIPEGFSGDVYIDATADINATLSTAGPGIAPRIHNVAAGGSGFDIALKNPGATTIATLMPQQYADAPSIPDASLTWGYPSALPVLSQGGSLSLPGNLALLVAANGIMFATGGNVRELTVDGAGSPTYADTGSTTVETE